jgi:hypothetical protein
VVDHLDTNILSETPSSIAPHDTKACNNGFVFGFSSILLDMQALRPPAERIVLLWQLYLENVDPLIKMIHTPSVQRQILIASRQPENVPPALEALMFAIYYAAVISIQSPEQCEKELGEDRQLLLTR